jgi:hypothetical protein
MLLHRSAEECARVGCAQIIQQNAMHPDRLRASWGTQKSDGRCNLIADLASVTVGAAGPHTTRSRPCSASLPKLNIHSCRYRFAAITDMQRFLYFCRHPQRMQEHGQFSRYRHQCTLFRILAAVRGQLQSPAPQIAVRTEGGRI